MRCDIFDDYFCHKSTYRKAAHLDMRCAARYSFFPPRRINLDNSFSELRRILLCYIKAVEESCIVCQHGGAAVHSVKPERILSAGARNKIIPQSEVLRICMERCFMRYS